MPEVVNSTGSPGRGISEDPVVGTWPRRLKKSMKVLSMLIGLGPLLGRTGNEPGSGNRKPATVSGRRWEKKMSGSGSRRAESSYGCCEAGHLMHETTIHTSPWS